jgi:hypothetical protein
LSAAVSGKSSSLAGGVIKISYSERTSASFPQALPFLPIASISRAFLETFCLPVLDLKISSVFLLTSFFALLFFLFELLR